MRVTVIGLGIEGQDLARFFASHGALVTVSDSKPESELTRQLAGIADLDVRLVLGGNPAGLADESDLLAITQGAPLSLPAIARAQERGLPITSRTQLFFELCLGTVIGISGSSGKTTTTSLVGAILKSAERKTFVGGNIGGPLLSRLEEIDADTWVALEVSHTQLQLTDRSPHIACLTNVTPNHLDQFTWGEYVALKKNLLAHQSVDDIAVLNLDNPVTGGMADSVAGRTVLFSLESEPPGDAAYLRDGRIILRTNGVESDVMAAERVPLRGRHNLENAVCATAVAAACEVAPGRIREAIENFQAVAHRLEPVREVDGVSYVNDSIATAPERALAGIRSFDEPIVLLLGGREKHLPLEELAEESARRCRAIICFGEAGALLARACVLAHRQGVCGPFIRRVGTLAEAVLLANQVARGGDVVLLSPACTSFDAYDNFERRGEEFRSLVDALPPREQALLSDASEQEAQPSQRK
jgi:UDP-N-acetylmuramoylalanine--D-glutamate ligase